VWAAIIPITLANILRFRAEQQPNTYLQNLRVAQVKGGVRSYFHKDHLGSSTVMTDASGIEITSSSTEYMPFGTMRNSSSIPTNYLYTDQELDSENGLYNYNARLYDPFIGRFISPDTIVPQPFNPQSLNRYSYCLNNPLIYTDPSGHIQIIYDPKEMTPEEYQSILAFEEYILWNYLYGREPDPSLYLDGFEIRYSDPDTMILTRFLGEVRANEAAKQKEAGENHWYEKTVVLGGSGIIQVIGAVGIDGGWAFSYSKENGFTNGPVLSFNTGIGTPSGSWSAFIQVTNARSVDELFGLSIQSGGGFKYGPAFTLDYIVGINMSSFANMIDQPTYEGWQFSAGLGYSPVALEIHSLGSLSVGKSFGGKETE